MKKQNKELAIPLEEFSKNFSEVEKLAIESEKKYYYIAVELKRKRKHLGLTQEELSLRSNIPRTTITKIESGSRNTTLHTIYSLARAMGSTVEIRMV